METDLMPTASPVIRQMSMALVSLEVLTYPGVPNGDQAHGPTDRLPSLTSLIFLVSVVKVWWTTRLEAAAAVVILVRLLTMLTPSHLQEPCLWSSRSPITPLPENQTLQILFNSSGSARTI